MKTIKKNKTVQTWIFLFSIILLAATQINYAHVSIKQLKREVEKKLSSYYPEDFKVSANKKGEITVEGGAGTLFDKLKISELISEVEGVQVVHNNIEVKTVATADAVIKANIENELQLNNVILEPQKIKVEVKNGVVSLSGTVSYFREKLMAQSIASWQVGILDMKSTITVLPPTVAVSDNNLKDLIADILKKHFSLETRVKFDVGNGIVDLSGSVKSLYAKIHIQQEIQHVLGVKDVVNEFSIEKTFE
ncbi:MAG: BON domain-containing protein [Ignavibacteriaceae bacterium]|jgi:osmotically-inducible protein OsmY